jgi:hypothetical protein
MNYDGGQPDHIIQAELLKSGSWEWRQSGSQEPEHQHLLHCFNSQACNSLANLSH